MTQPLHVRETLTIQRAVDAVSRWIELRGAPPSSADADHSSLLRRLLGGLPPFPFKPPRRFSYPDYRLAAGESVKVGEVSQPDEALFGKGVFIVDQARYNLIEKQWNGTLVLEWPEEPGSRYEVTPPDSNGFRSMQRVGTAPPSGREGT